MCFHRFFSSKYQKMGKKIVYISYYIENYVSGPYERPHKVHIWTQRPKKVHFVKFNSSQSTMSRNWDELRFIGSIKFLHAKVFYWIEPSKEHQNISLHDFQMPLLLKKEEIIINHTVSLNRKIKVLWVRFLNYEK